MFDQFKTMGAMAGLMKDLPRIKARLAEVREELEAMRASGSAGGGAVRATATGTLRIVSVEIEPAVLAGGADDRGAVEALITEAVNLALEAARSRAEDLMRRSADELGIPLPTGGLAGLLG